MLAFIEIEYHAQDVVKKMPRDKYEELRISVEQLKLPEWKEDAEKGPAPEIWLYGEYLVDLMTDGIELAHMGVEFKVKRFKGTYRAATVSSNGVSHHVHVAIPAIGLLAMNEVKVLEDACTNELQRQLNDGWRIVAVCPPDAKRRPDYILGRSPEFSKRRD